MDEDEEVDVYCGTYCASFVSLYLSFVFRDTQWLKFKESEWYDASNTHTYNFIRLLIWAFVFKACISYPFSDVNRINNCMTKLMMRPYFFLLHPMHRFCCFCSPFCLPWLLIHFHECLLFFVHKVDRWGCDYCISNTLFSSSGIIVYSLSQSAWSLHHSSARHEWRRWRRILLENRHLLTSRWLWRRRRRMKKGMNHSLSPFSFSSIESLLMQQ